MSDSNIVIAFFAILVAGKIALIVQCFLNKKSFSSPSSSSPYLVMSDMETGPQVLVEDPMTQRLLLSGGGGPEESQVDLQIPPPVYTIKDEHLEFENDPPPPSFADAVPSSHPFKSKRRLSRLSSNGSNSNTSHRHRSRRHSLFRYHPQSMDHSTSDNNNNSNNSNNNNSNDNHAAPDIVSNSALGVDDLPMEATILRIPNVARWVAESRRDTYMALISEQHNLGVVPTNFDPNLDTYQHESTSDNMRVLPTLGVLSPSVIVHM
ncbi:hypothetical protein BGX29_000343 [Mortierella sp. GBA35]|nr:hypothetical protein BGX29_000343 [Mortierella sp. GBA35]KAG0198150.1 hypothetical protein BGX33_012541 [Mortierella sp. NVP41]